MFEAGSQNFIWLADTSPLFALSLPSLVFWLFFHPYAISDCHHVDGSEICNEVTCGSRQPIWTPITHVHSFSDIPAAGDIVTVQLVLENKAFTEIKLNKSPWIWITMCSSLNRNFDSLWCSKTEIPSGLNHLCYHLSGCVFWCSVLYKEETREEIHCLAWSRNCSSGGQANKILRKQVVMNHLSVRVLY
jgi:hypothetical protein